MIEIRVTLPENYTHPECSGHIDLLAREGHYVSGESVVKALQKIGQERPNEVLDVQNSEGVYIGRFVVRHDNVVMLPPPPGEPRKKFHEISVETCRKLGVHLSNCDSDGLCSFCGEQE